MLLPFSLFRLSRAFMHWPLFNFPYCAAPAQIHIAWPQSQPTAQTVKLWCYFLLCASICKEKTYQLHHFSLYYYLHHYIKYMDECISLLSGAQRPSDQVPLVLPCLPGMLTATEVGCWNGGRGRRLIEKLSMRVCVFTIQEGWESTAAIWESRSDID